MLQINNNELVVFGQYKPGVDNRYQIRVIIKGMGYQHKHDFVSGEAARQVAMKVALRMVIDLQHWITAGRKDESWLCENVGQDDSMLVKVPAK